MRILNCHWAKATHEFVFKKDKYLTVVYSEIDYVIAHLLKEYGFNSKKPFQIQLATRAFDGYHGQIRRLKHNDYGYYRIPKKWGFRHSLVYFCEDGLEKVFGFMPDRIYFKFIQD